VSSYTKSMQFMIPLMRTSRIAVVDGRWCRSEVFDRRPRSLLVGVVAALCCCTSPCIDA
jgi:hypothetical protein